MRPTLKSLIIFLAGALTSGALFVLLEREVGSGHDSGTPETGRQPVVTPDSNREPPQVSTRAVSSSPQVSNVPMALADPENVHLQEIQRSADEDTRLLTSVLSLSPDQEAQIHNVMMENRLSITPPQESERRAITKLLSSEQMAAFSEYLEHKRRGDIERHAAVQLNQIERVSGPLSDVQKDTLFATLLARDMEEQAVSDREILKTILSERQFELWSQSQFATSE